MQLHLWKILSSRWVNIIQFNQRTVTHAAKYTSLIWHAKQTSQEINDAIDHRFTPFVADFIKRTWAMDQLAEMSEANHWGIAAVQSLCMSTHAATVGCATVHDGTGIAQSALAAAVIVDPTGA